LEDFCRANGAPVALERLAELLCLGDSVVFGLFVLKSGLPRGNEVFHLTAIDITASILAHSLSDVHLARWLKANVPPEPASGEKQDQAF